MTATKIVLVAGAGVVGLCVAHFALRKGHRVIIVERGAPDHDRGEIRRRAPAITPPA